MGCFLCTKTTLFKHVFLLTIVDSGALTEGSTGEIVQQTSIVETQTELPTVLSSVAATDRDYTVKMQGYSVHSQTKSIELKNVKYGVKLT